MSFPIFSKHARLLALLAAGFILGGLIYLARISFEPTPGMTSSEPLPQGYTLENYTIEETSTTSCSVDDECETPAGYMMQSRCPFTSLCLENKCTVVCPSYQ